MMPFRLFICAGGKHFKLKKKYLISMRSVALYIYCLNQFCNLENIVLAVKIVHFLILVLKEIIEKIVGQ